MKHLSMVRQRSGRDSRLCCVAMVAGVEYHDVQEFSDKRGFGQDDWSMDQVARALAWFRVHTWVEPVDVLGDNRLMIVAVPSVNVQGDMHTVVVDTRGQVGNMLIMDPNRGLRDRNYYSLSGLRANYDCVEARPLFCWSRVLCCERLAD